MIVVPTQEVAPGALNTGRAIPQGDAAAPLTAGINSAVSDLGDIALVQQRQRNADRLFRAETEIGDAYREFEAQVRQRQGQDAWGVTDDASKWWDENSARFSDALENDAQKRLFDRSVAQLRDRSLTSVSRFEQQQRQRSLTDSARASMANSIDFAAANASDPAALASARREISQRVVALSAANGWDSEVRDAELASQLTALHEQVLGELTDTNPQAAKQYYDDNEVEIQGSQRDRLRKAIDVSSTVEAAQVASDDIMSRGLDEKGALAAARAEYSGKQRDEVVRRLKTRFNEIAAAEQAVEQQAVDAAWDVFGRTGSLSAVPPSIQARLPGRTLASMRAQEFNPAHLVSTDWDKYAELSEMMATNPVEFSEMDLRSEFHLLNPRERNALLEAQTAIRENRQSSVATLTQQLAQVSREMGWDSGDAEKRGLFERRVREEIAAYQDDTGNKASYDVRQQIIDRLAMDGEVIGGGLFGLTDPDRQLFEVIGTEDEAAFRTNVPDDERFQIEQALEAAGLDVTDEAVLQLYLTRAGILSE